MPILSKDEAQTILKKTLAFSSASECEISLNGSEGGNIRYARNAVSTAGENSNMSMSVSSTFGKRTGVATINEFDDASLQKAVKRAEELAKLAPENPEYMPLLGPQAYSESIAFVPATAAVNPDVRAESVSKSLQVAEEGKLEAAGFIENTTEFNALINSKGLFGYNTNTNISFSVTMRNQAGTGSGYVGRSYNDVARFDALALTKIAASKANGSAGARAIEPGKYTVILEPLAAGNILSNMFQGFDARNADEGRSFMSKKGGGTRLGEQLFDEKVTIYSDPHHVELPGSTWSGGGNGGIGGGGRFGGGSAEKGLPLTKTTWVEKGVVKNLSYSRFWAQQKNVSPLASPTGMIMDGGTASLDDLIKGTQKGILVTRFFYIRMVDPQTVLLTGLTRDGTFYIENGKVQFPVKNFRFNESPVIMLNNVEELGRPERTGNMIVPPMKIRDFTFTSLSDAV